MKIRYWAAGVTAAAIAGLWAINASSLAPAPHGPPRLLAHRGIYQRYDRTGVDNQTCTASRILPPTNDFLENTLPSIRASFDAGADVVEIDVHPTTDDQFVVFHDWTLDCRTDGHGTTRQHSLAELKALDIGYGYTADGGKTFPFRGRFKGQMPSLGEVLEAFPDKYFLINIKSNDPAEADALVAYLERNGLMSPRLSAYGGAKPVARLASIAAGMRPFSKDTIKACGIRYLAFGWMGIMPKACRNTTIVIPQDMTWMAWGYPNRLQRRFASAGSYIYLVGAQKNANGLQGINSPEALQDVPASWEMGIWTDDIAVIAPLVRLKNALKD